MPCAAASGVLRGFFFCRPPPVRYLAKSVQIYTRPGYFESDFLPTHTVRSPICGVESRQRARCAGFGRDVNSRSVLERSGLGFPCVGRAPDLRVECLDTRTDWKLVGWLLGVKRRPEPSDLESADDLSGKGRRRPLCQTSSELNLSLNLAMCRSLWCSPRIFFAARPQYGT